MVNRLRYGGFRKALSVGQSSFWYVVAACMADGYRNHTDDLTVHLYSCALEGKKKRNLLFNEDAA